MILRPDFYLQVPQIVYNSLPETMRAIINTGDGNKNYIRLQSDSGDFVHTNISNNKTQIVSGYKKFYGQIAPQQLKLEITLRETRYEIYSALEKTQNILENTWETDFPEVLELIDTITPNFDDRINNGGNGRTLRYGLLSISESLTKGNYGIGNKRQSTDNNKIKFCFYEFPNFT